MGRTGKSTAHRPEPISQTYFITPYPPPIMQVFIDGQWHTPEDAPLVLRLTEQDRRTIATQPKEARFWVQSDPRELQSEVDIYVKEAIEIYEEENPEETKQHKASGGTHGKIETDNILLTLTNGTDLSASIEGHPLKHSAMLKHASDRTPHFRLGFLLAASAIATDEGEVMAGKALEELAKRLDKKLYEAQQGGPTSDDVN